MSIRYGFSGNSLIISGNDCELVHLAYLTNLYSCVSFRFSYL